MRIGQSKIARMRVPAFLKGNVILLDLVSVRGKWGIVSCLPPFEFADAVFLNQYRRIVQKEGAVLLGMLPCADPIFDPNLPKAKALRIPLIADPLRRLQRVLGIQGPSFSNRCQSFIFDPRGVIRNHLVHLLNWRGMSFLLETLKHCQDLYPQPTQEDTNGTTTNISLVSSVQTHATRGKWLHCT